MDEHKLNQVATLIAVSMPDVVILLEQVKRLLAFVWGCWSSKCLPPHPWGGQKAVHFHTVGADLWSSSRTALILLFLVRMWMDLQWPQITQILCLPPTPPEASKESWFSTVRWKGWQIPRKSAILSSVTPVQIQSDDGSRNGGFEWLTVMDSLLPRLILRLPKLNMQTNSSSDWCWAFHMAHHSLRRLVGLLAVGWWNQTPSILEVSWRHTGLPFLSTEPPVVPDSEGVQMTWYLYDIVSNQETQVIKEEVQPVHGHEIPSLVYSSPWNSQSKRVVKCLVNLRSSFRDNTEAWGNIL